MRNYKYNLLLVIAFVLLLLMFCAGPKANAQSQQTIKAFLEQPWIPVETSEPANTVTTATATFTYSDQPDAGNTLTISGAGFDAEVYEFYENGTTYSGDNIGVEIGAAEDASYANLEAAINTYSEFVVCSLTTGTNTVLLTADASENPTFRGHNGNYITLTDDVANATIPAALTGGTSASAGQTGSLWYEDDATTSVGDALWVKLADTRYTSGVWRNLFSVMPVPAPLMTAISNHGSTTTAVTITAAQNGTHFILGENGSDPLTFNLPDAEVGLWYVFTDLDATAAADLVINPQDDDKIDAQDAGVSLNATGDAVGETRMLKAINDERWITITSFGTWTTGS
ncbi:MAG: hypothetical protein BWY95_00192 [Bacteroidetes bacterium ADurb.BinA104]|nr:MAG: hypothetical protein BWY95_00192 [Bacteroidetes bacterium ADurb.BinA104]